MNTCGLFFLVVLYNASDIGNFRHSTGEMLLGLNSRPLDLIASSWLVIYFYSTLVAFKHTPAKVASLEHVRTHSNGFHLS